MKKIKLLTGFAALTIPFTTVVTSCAKQNETKDFYRDISLNENWKFRLNDQEQAQDINLPHDFSISQDFRHSWFDIRKKLTSGTTGFLPGGIGYYHKDFILPKKDNPTVILNFDGAYNDTIVTVNGQIVGNNKYGYNPFAFDISKYVTADGVTNNTLDVIVRHEYITCSRWYPGSGIYRDVNISVLNNVHIAHNGTYVTTPNLKQEVGKDVTVNVEVDVQNENNGSKNIYLQNRVVDASGTVVCDWTKSNQQTINAHETNTFKSNLKVNNPKLWSAETPNLYYVETQVVDGNSVVDQYKTRFGFRYYEWDKKGFSVNGKITKIHGVCLHHDQGALGAASYNDAMYRQLCIMKEMGMNAVRTSHNCPDEDFLRLCDELGFYVSDEAFDTWEFAKTKHDSSEIWKEKIGAGNQLIDAKPDMTWHNFVMRSMVKRDRNCPSVFMWSLGNELHEGDWHDAGVSPERKKEVENEMLGFARELKGIAEELDHDDKTKRWCAIALERNPNSDSDEKDYPKCKIARELHNDGGLMGFNYGSAEQTEKALDEFVRVYGSETASARNSRGMYSGLTEYKSKDVLWDDGHHHITSYDGSGTTVASEVIWRTIKNDGYGGQFVWTGFDYIGEPSPWCFNTEDTDSKEQEEVFKNWPYPNSSYYGIVDTCGFPKDSYYLYRAHLKQDEKVKTTLHLVGSLNQKNMYKYSGQTEKGFPDNFTPIDIYTNAPYVIIKNNNTPIAKITRHQQDTSKKQGHYYTYTAESKSTDLCVINDTEFKTQFSHDLYSNILVDASKVTKLTAEAYEDAQFTKKINDTVGLNHLSPIDSSVKNIVCESNKPSITADGKSLAYVTVDLNDKNGNLITDYDSQVEINVSLQGNGKILGVDNGDQSTDKKWQNPDALLSYKQAKIRTYAGKALIIVCSNKNPGIITLRINDKTVKITSE